MFTHYFLVGYYISLDYPDGGTAVGSTIITVKNIIEDYFIRKTIVINEIEKSVLESSPNVAFSKEKVIIIGLSKLTEAQYIAYNT